MAEIVKNGQNAKYGQDGHTKNGQNGKKID